MRHLFKKRRQELKQKRKEKKMQEQNQPQGISPQEALAQINAQLGQVRGQIEGSKSQYANSYITLASSVASKLFEGGLSAIDAVAKGFDFSDHFRREAARLESSIKETAVVPPVLAEQEKNLLANLEAVNSFVAQQNELAKAVAAPVAVQGEVSVPAEV